MLFKHKHLLRELCQNGRRATAEIISVKTVGEGSSIRALWAPAEDLSDGWIDCLMRLRVIPAHDGELPFETSVMTRVHTLKYLGGTIPVWYDPGNTSKVVVADEADLTGEIQWMADAERLAHRHDQRPGLVWTPLGDGLLPIEVLAKPGKGRVTVKRHLDKLIRDHAAAAVEYLRSHAAEVAPDLDPDWLARNDLHIGEPNGDVPADLTAQNAGSAGLAIAAALVSLMSGRNVRTEVAVTGVLTPAGELLPVRGFREKAHCAKRCYAQFLVAPKANEPDVYQVSQQDRRDLQLVFAVTPAEALHTALTKHPTKGHSRVS
ncbi:MAG: S16 family serine protease [Trebonia sp.]